MKSVARELVEKNGVDADKLVDLLVRCAASEFASYYYLSLLRINLIGAEGEALKKLVEDIRLEDRNHFEALLPRVYELGGAMPSPIGDHSGSPIADVLQSQDVRSAVETLMKSAEFSVRAYTQLCNMTCGKDNRTYSLALAILHEEIEHQVWFLDFIARGVKEGFTHATTPRGASPFVAKFLHSVAPRPATPPPRRLAY